MSKAIDPLGRQRSRGEHNITFNVKKWGFTMWTEFNILLVRSNGGLL